MGGDKGGIGNRNRVAVRERQEERQWCICWTRVKSGELEKVSMSNQIQNGRGTHLVQVRREMVSDPAGAGIKSERPGRK